MKNNFIIVLFLLCPFTALSQITQVSDGQK